MQHDYEQAQRLARIETILDRIDRELFGNGKPGKLQVLQDDVEDLQQSRAWGKGAMAVISALLTAVGSVLTAHIWRGPR